MANLPNEIWVLQDRETGKLWGDTVAFSEDQCASRSVHSWLKGLLGDERLDSYDCRQIMRLAERGKRFRMVSVELSAEALATLSPSLNHPPKGQQP